MLHSFAVNSLSIKVDAVPGRLNQASFMIKRKGYFMGNVQRYVGPITLLCTLSLKGFLLYLI